jgi:hypothetical protein
MFCALRHITKIGLDACRRRKVKTTSTPVCFSGPSFCLEIYREHMTRTVIYDHWLNSHSRDAFGVAKYFISTTFHPRIVLGHAGLYNFGLLHHVTAFISFLFDLVVIQYVVRPRQSTWWFRRFNLKNDESTNQQRVLSFGGKKVVEHLQRGLFKL